MSFPRLERVQGKLKKGELKKLGRMGIPSDLRSEIWPLVSGSASRSLQSSAQDKNTCVDSFGGLLGGVGGLVGWGLCVVGVVRGTWW